ncbi:MAG: ferrous iron transport protein B [Candidatus Margulisiibacteriota bacterium]|nr:MAG: ferrous iron transport protein B [Candidatus Margulisbacteria bacterium GWD2_39_127]OGI05291.1 MAG: ferrous iron transport protein B [Candidatus Margulisbacteria bacterium GWF2_38_17]OGI10850.1 MAG: ferrous iron transport protein B [Candidatus Margulisbacteria bacterium GWE2_39_32]PZM83536.1 MAG: ferrous iron transport protein B [Candidatus Margulisiibacteriota bacterium]HAR64286.1 ferrous iron transport protein B [Candidatus Margulisiibacteriota bacterium]
MHRHQSHKPAATALDKKTVVLVGNPNVGKSIFFNYFTGMYVDVSNYPGTTIEISQGKYGDYIILDTPGIYSVSSFNDEEKVARDIILGADIIINIVDAVHLERDLFLTQQLIDMGIPMIVAVNLMDEAKKEGIEVDLDLLSHLLGVPVVGTIAVKKQGFDEIKELLPKAMPGNINPELHLKLHEMLRVVGSQPEALMIMEGDPYVSERHGIEPVEARGDIYIKRREIVNDIIDHVVRDVTKVHRFKNKLEQWMLQPFLAFLIMCGALFVVYKFVGVFVAQTVVGVTEKTVMQGIYEPAMRGLVAEMIDPVSILGNILVGDFGLLTMTVTYLVGLLLPLVFGFYFALSILEDCGYLPRLAVFVDRSLNVLGLNGRAIIPLILGFGCVTAGTITTRLLGSEREKKIAIILLQFAIPCSAQLGVIAALLAPIGSKYLFLYSVVIFGFFIAVGSLLNLTLKGESTPLFIELPSLRMPKISNVMTKTTMKTYHFMYEAIPWFVLGALIVSFLHVFNLLQSIEVVFAPLVVKWLQLPQEAARVFIMGFVRRDFGAAGLTSLALTPIQIVIALVTITLFVPCVASLVILFKEQSWKHALLIWLGTLFMAFFVGGVISHVFI